MTGSFFWSSRFFVFLGDRL